MLFAAVMIHTAHPALENAEEAFDDVRRRLAARIFAVAVIDGLMRSKRFSGLFVELRLVRVERRVQHDMRAQNLLDGRDGEIVNLD